MEIFGIEFDPPELLNAEHNLAEFDSGTSPMDEWLRGRAVANQAGGAARTFVVLNKRRVIGYYALATSAVTASDATGKFRRNMPDPIPVVLLGRLAVDREYQKKGLGKALFIDAAIRVLAAAETIGIRGLLVHAVSDEVKPFYFNLGFDELPTEPRTLMITLQDLRRAIKDLH